MSFTYESILTNLKQSPKTWLITGVAGFIGSNLLEALLKLDQTVIGLDNFSTGYQRNLDEVRSLVKPEQWSRSTFIEGDIRDLETCRSACAKVDYVLHQAALGSVPRSLDDPIRTNENNISGFLNMLVAARDAKVRRFVYAASSSTYGDHPALPKREDTIGRPLSPYAVTKYVNELYADVFHRCYGFSTIGLRYFNVFGPRQDPNGAYAAVIPKFVMQLMRHESPVINGDGSFSRDFTCIDNVIQINLLAAMTTNPDALDTVYNVAFGERTTLNELAGILKEVLAPHDPAIQSVSILHGPERAGDVPHSLAAIDKAQQLLGYHPAYDLRTGMKETIGTGEICEAGGDKRDNKKPTWRFNPKQTAKTPRTNKTTTQSP